MFDYSERRRRLSERMRAEGVDILFLGLSADLEYLSGVERGIPFFGQSSVRPRLGGGRLLPPRRRPGLRAAAHGGRVRPAGAAGRRDRDRERDRRRVRRVRAGREGPRACGHGRRRRPRVGGDDPQPRPRLRLRSAPHRVVARQRRSGGSRRPRSSRRWGGPAARWSGRWRPSHPASQPGVSMAELVEEVELQLRLAGSRTPSFATHIFTGLDPDSLDSSTRTARDPDARGNVGDVRLRRRRRRVLLRLRPHCRRGGADRRSCSTRTT